MKAAFIQKPGPPENIHYGDLEKPRPGNEQCLVKISAVAVNPMDTYIRSGMVKANLPTPYVLGSDLAGTIEEIGPGVHRFKPGDKVWGTNQGMQGRQGTFAEFAAVDEKWLYPLPAGIKEEEAAAISLVGITAHLGLAQHARLKTGETLFVNGGAGGVGSSVLQMAKAMGARVATTAGSPEKVALCRELGADLAINYKTEKVEEAIKGFAPEGVNVWWETLREVDFDRAISHLAMRGRMIVMAGRDARPVFPVGPFYVKNCSLHGFAMFNSSPEEQRVAAEQINRWMVEGKVKARIDRILPLSETSLAHHLQEESTIRKAGTLSGKIVLKP